MFTLELVVGTYAAVVGTCAAAYALERLFLRPRKRSRV